LNVQLGFTDYSLEVFLNLVCNKSKHKHHLVEIIQLLAQLITHNEVFCLVSVVYDAIRLN